MLNKVKSRILSGKKVKLITMLFIFVLLPVFLWGLSWWGNSGKGLVLDKSQSQYVYFPTTSLIPTSGDFTLSVWVLAENEQLSGYVEVLAQLNAHSTIYLPPLPFWSLTGAHFYLGINDNGNVRLGDDWMDTGVPFFTDALWHNYTVVKSASDTKLYIDGVLRASKGSAIRNPEGDESWIGKQYAYGTYWNYQEYFNGDIDEIKVWNTALTQEQIREKMHTTLHYTEPNLFTYIQFNEWSTSLVYGHRYSDQVIQGNIENGATKQEVHSPTGNGSVSILDINSEGLYSSSNGFSMNVNFLVNGDHHNVYIHKINENGDYLDNIDSSIYYVYDYDSNLDLHFNQINITPTQNLDEYYAKYPQYLKMNYVPPTYDNFWTWNRYSADSFNDAQNKFTLNHDFTTDLNSPINSRSRATYGFTRDYYSEISELSPPDEGISTLNPDLSISIEYSSYGHTSTISGVSGNAFLYEGTTLLETIPLDNSMIAGNTLTFTPSTTLTEGSYYNIKISDGAIVDDNNMPVLGITDNSGWNFTASGSIPQAGNCVSLNGDNSYITISDYSDNLVFSNQFTVEAWIKVDEFDRTWQAIVTKGDTSWRLQRYQDTNFINFVAGGASITGTTNVNDGKWHHIAGIHDYNNLYLYIDGVLDSSSSSASSTVSNGYDVCIGENQQAAGRYFDGMIDDVRIWSSARTAKEIRENMNHPIPGNTGSLVGYWKLDEDTSSDAFDSAGGRNGTKSNCTNLPSSAPFGSGTSEMMYITSIGNYSFLSGEVVMDVSTLSESSTFQITKINVSPNILPDIENTYSSQYWILYNFGNADFTADMGLEISENISAEPYSAIKLCSRDETDDDAWKYLATATEITARNNTVSFDDISSTGQLIIGKQTTSPSVTQLSPENYSTDNVLSPDFVITFDDNVSSGAGNILLYDSDDQLVETLPASNANITDNVAEFNFVNALDTDSSYYILVENTAFHKFGCYYDGISSSGQWSFSTMGIRHNSGNCLELNGTSQFAEFEEGLIPNTGDFSVTLWAKADDAQTGYREIISQLGGVGANFYLGLSTNGNVRCGDNWSDTGVTFPLDNGWHYYSVVKSSTDTHLYIDGMLKASKGSAITNPMGENFRIGRQYGTCNEFFMGQVDELKTYDAALTSDEIRRNMHLTANSSDPNLVSYIQFNDENTQIIDLAGGKTGEFTGSKEISHIEVGNGTVQSLSTSVTGNLDFSTLGVSVDVTSVSEETTYYVTKLEQAPTINPDGEVVFNAQLWAVHAFGDANVTANIGFIPSENIDEYYESYPDIFFINYREIYFHYNWWHSYNPNEVDSENNSVTINNWNDNGLFVLSENIPVSITSIIPGDGSVVGPDVVFEVTFDDCLFISSGNLSIYRLFDDSLFEQMDVSTLPLINDDTTLQVDPVNELEDGVTYYVNIDPDCIESCSETVFGGISDKETWNFTVQFPQLSTPEVAITIVGNNVQLTWDEVTGALSYRIEASDNPDDGFVQVAVGLSTLSWSEPISTAKKFYHVYATEIPPSKATFKKKVKLIKIRN